MTRPPIPGGKVSTIRGRRQAPALTWITRLVLGLGVISAALPDDEGRAVATVAVGVVVAVPLLRVAWLVFRWVQERDWRFALTGTGLLAVVALGAVLAAL